jgi:hypothetical protein
LKTFASLHSSAISPRTLSSTRFFQQPIDRCAFRMPSFWSEACTHASSKSLQALLDAAYGSCGATVTHTRCRRFSFIAIFAASDCDGRSVRTACVFSVAASCFVGGGGSAQMIGSTYGSYMDGLPR